jgi:formylglycine-generating enzyme
MGGDVFQWEETAFPGGARGIAGGSYASTSDALARYTAGNIHPTGESSDCGFRVASVPEPTTLALVMLTILIVAAWHISICSKRASFWKCAL